MTRRALGSGPSSIPTTPSGPSPVSVRLMGEDGAVRRLVSAMQSTGNCGPASFRPARDGGGTRAYLTVVVPEVTE
ncbi:hypothetical protein [Streptomyces sp. gCLA4]|uniref:hypothetical protein n=1 Tax=Streptomyces sp. gCLA4 TaxID=1873416 RepID=UPI001602BE25|nr:hypothetical protein [Streptomyces sp. gCLA4]